MGRRRHQRCPLCLVSSRQLLWPCCESPYDTGVRDGEGWAMSVDTVRQTANVVGALFQVLAGPLGMLIFGVGVGAVSDANSTLVVPAGYAFSIWGLIFALCLAYAVY